MTDCESSLTHLTDWFQSCLTDCFSEAASRLHQLKDELKHKDHQIGSLESRLRRLGQEEEDLRARERLMTTEVEGLRGKLREKDEERQEGYTREERINRQC